MKQIVRWLLMLMIAAALAMGGCARVQPALPGASGPSPTPGPLAAAWTPGQLEVHVIDVDHGDAQLIVSPTGETMLIDCARVEKAPKVARYLRDVLGTLTVDYLVMTHYDPDHDGGCAPLLYEYGLRVRRAVLDRGGNRDEVSAAHYHNYYDAVSDAKLNLVRQRVRVGDTIDMGERLNVSVLSVGDIDTRTALGVPIVGENDNSIVLWLTMGRFDYWTGGDLSGEDTANYANVEAAIIPHVPRPADAMRANHHGSRYNNSAALLDALQPSAILVSATTTVTNYYTLYRIKTHGDAYCTQIVTNCDAYGDIVLTSVDGETFSVEGKSYTSR